VNSVTSGVSTISAAISEKLSDCRTTADTSTAAMM
jgi:hypothetical protein